MVTPVDARPDTRPRQLIDFPAGTGSLPALTRWLSAAVAAAEDDPADLVLAVRGRTAEVAGADVADWTRWEKAVRRLERLPRVTVGAVDGTVTGPAFGLLLALDLVVATPRTVLTCLDVPAGRLPGMAVHRLAKYVGLGHAKRIVLAGRPLPAAEALRLGIVGEVSADPAQAAGRWLEPGGADRARAAYLSRRLLEESYAHSFEDALGGMLAAQERALREAADPTGTETR